MASKDLFVLAQTEYIHKQILRFMSVSVNQYN